MNKLVYDESSDISNFDFEDFNFYENNILTEYFIEKYQDRINWLSLTIYQNLSETFVEKYQNKVYWPSISLKQKLSNKFIAKYFHKLTFYLLKGNQNVDQAFIEKICLLK